MSSAVYSAPRLPEIPDEARELFDRLWLEPEMPVDLLRMQVQDYRQVVHLVGKERERIDVALADRIAQVCLQLLGEISRETPAHERRLIQVAVRYFVEEEDADGDMLSAFGFADDVAVLNAVLTSLGRDELVIVVDWPL